MGCSTQENAPPLERFQKLDTETLETNFCPSVAPRVEVIIPLYPLQALTSPPTTTTACTTVSAATPVQQFGH